MKELEKPFFKKKWDQEKLQKKQNVIVKMPHLKIKSIARNKGFLYKETKPRMNCEWIAKPILKNPLQKNWRNSRTQRETAAFEQNTTSEKTNCCSNTVFSI